MTTTAERYVPAAGRAWLTGSYDRAVALTMRERRWRPALVAGMAADLPPGGRAIEVGCGTGTLTLALAEARPDAQVAGVDGDPEILALAQRKAGADRVVWHQALADALPFDRAAVDVVVCSLLVHHLSDAGKAAALAEAARVLVPGGALHIADWGVPRGPATALGAQALQLVDGREGPTAMVRGQLPALLTVAGFRDARRHGALRTVGGTFESWRATT